ncbi:MAG: hypothetical protein JSR58_06345 [Verrucomicrobia bacterium]|nr:hypothetical protein [Verrucomicrobiota bacterium]
MTNKYTPVNDYANNQSIIYWGAISEDNDKQRQSVILQDRVISIHRLVLDAARAALLTPLREFLLPGKITADLDGSSSNAQFIVSQKCDKIKIIPSSERAAFCQDPLTHKNITPDDLRTKKALFIGNYAFHVDSLLLHYLKKTPCAQLEHPIEKRPLTQLEQVQLIAELSLCLSIDDSYLLEQTLCDPKRLNVLQLITDKSDLIFLINAEQLFSCMKPARIRILTPQIWRQFETLLNTPQICELLQRPILKTYDNKFFDVLLHQEECKGLQLKAPDPLKDFADKKSFIFWGICPVNEQAREKLKLNVPGVEFEDAFPPVADMMKRGFMQDIFYLNALVANNGDILLAPSCNTRIQFSKKYNCWPCYERIIPIQRKIVPSFFLNQQEGNTLLDPITLDEIPLDQLNAPHIISIGNYVLTLTSCLRTMLSRTVNDDDEILHPVENRALTYSERMNFIVDVSKKLGIDNPGMLEAYCFNHVEYSFVQKSKNQHFGVAPFPSVDDTPLGPQLNPNPSLTGDVFFAANFSLLLSKVLSSSNQPITPGHLLWELSLKHKALSGWAQNLGKTMIQMVIDVVEANSDDEG